MSHINLTYHIIWRTKKSQRTLNEDHERELFAYIFGFCRNKKSKLYRINAMPDHVHMCIEIHPSIALSDFMKVLKQRTSLWMKERRKWFPDFEGWGDGYAAFTYSAKERDTVVTYIKNQKAHHKAFDFRDEYRKMLMEFEEELNEDGFLED